MTRRTPLGERVLLDDQRPTRDPANIVLAAFFVGALIGSLFVLLVFWVTRR